MGARSMVKSPHGAPIAFPLHAPRASLIAVRNNPFATQFPHETTCASPIPVYSSEKIIPYRKHRGGH